MGRQRPLFVADLKAKKREVILNINHQEHVLCCSVVPKSEIVLSSDSFSISKSNRSTRGIGLGRGRCSFTKKKRKWR